MHDLDDATSDVADHHRQDTATSAGSVSWLERGVVAALTLIIVSQLSIFDLLANTTPTGGDLGAHVWFADWMRDHALPNLNMWSSDWFAGFPAGLFYFPFPALATLALDVALPYGIALKLVTVTGPLLAPYATWKLVRALGAGRAASLVAAAATVTFLFEQHHTIYGGNMSSVLAGMYSYSLGLSLAMLTGAHLCRWLHDRDNLARLVVTAVAAAMCHILAAAALTIIAAAVVAASGPVRQIGRRALDTLRPALLAVGLSAVWWLPLIMNIDATTDMGYGAETTWIEWLFPQTARERFGVDTPVHYWATTALVAAGAVIAVARRHRTLAVTLTICVTYASLYRFLPSGTVWNARWLPGTYLFAHISAAVAAVTIISELAAHLARRRPRLSAVPAWARATAVAVGVAAAAAPAATVTGIAPAWLPTGATHNRSHISHWTSWSYSGYEHKPGWYEYRQAVDVIGRTAADHGCGRALWEAGDDTSQYGTPMAMMLLPYWTDGCVASSEGLYFESSLTTPYHFIAQYAASSAGSAAVRDMPYTQPGDTDTAVEMMRSLGINWYLTKTVEARDKARQHPELTELTSSGPWTMFEIAGVARVEALQRQVVTLHGAQHSQITAWRHDPSLPVTTVDIDGAARIANIEDAQAASVPLTETADITNIDIGDRHVSFDVTEPGLGVVIRNSWSESWDVSGADGPWPIGPNMMLVVPTDTHVELTAGTAPGTTVGWTLTIGTALRCVGAAGVARGWLRTPRLRRRSSSHTVTTS